MKNNKEILKDWHFEDYDKSISSRKVLYEFNTLEKNRKSNSMQSFLQWVEIDRKRKYTVNDILKTDGFTFQVY